MEISFDVRNVIIWIYDISLPQTFNTEHSVLFIKYENFKGKLFVVDHNKQMEWYNDEVNEWIVTKTIERYMQRVGNDGYYSYFCT